MKLFEQTTLGRIQLKNRVVMAPLTRSRATGNVPNDLLATYYAQRAGAGLLITEGTSPSPNGVGYARIPGLYNREQVAGWKKVTEAVHAKGGRIFLQMMHTGRVFSPAVMMPKLPSGILNLEKAILSLSEDLLFPIRIWRKSFARNCRSLLRMLRSSTRRDPKAIRIIPLTHKKQGQQFLLALFLLDD